MQTRKRSLFEVTFSVVVGYLVGLAVNLFVLPPILKTEVSTGEGAIVAIIFSVISIIRSFILRRIFNDIERKRELEND